MVRAARGAAGEKGKNMAENNAWGWASYDVDDDNGADYCSRTDVHEDGTVHRYDATNGDFSNGHGHAGYASMSAFLADDKKDWSRSPSDPDSANRAWEDRY